MKKKKIIIIAVAIVVVIVAALIFLKVQGGSKDMGVPVTTGTAETMDIEEIVSIKGTISGSEVAEVSSSVNYEVASILVKEGDKVNKGQLLATLDGDSIKSDYNKAVNSLNQSKFQYDASQSLYAEGAISQEELIRARTTYENDSTTVNSFSNMDQTNVKSPIAGTVTRVNTSQGRAANDTKDQEPMFVIEDLENLQMEVKIGEFDISKIVIGQKVSISADVIGDAVVTGVVSKIAPTGELKDPSGKEMVVPVTIDVDKGSSTLIAGVSASADILIQKSEKTLSVPIDALLQEPSTGKNCIFLVKDNKLKKIEVELGIEGNFNVEIHSDKVKTGDVVVLSPTFDFTDGMPVSTAANDQMGGGAQGVTK